MHCFFFVCFVGAGENENIVFSRNVLVYWGSLIEFFTEEQFFPATILCQLLHIKHVCQLGTYLTNRRFYAGKQHRHNELEKIRSFGIDKIECICIKFNATIIVGSSSISDIGRGKLLRNGALL